MSKLKLREVLRTRLNSKKVAPPPPPRSLKPKLRSISIVTQHDNDFLMQATPRSRLDRMESFDVSTDDDSSLSVTPRTMVSIGDLTNLLEGILNERTVTQLQEFIELHVSKLIGNSNTSGNSPSSSPSVSPNAGSQIDDLPEKVRFMMNKFKFTAQRCTCLHVLAKSSNVNAPDMIAYLVDEGGVDVDIRDRHDATPLFYSCSAGHSEVTATLLSLGASVNIKDSVGHFPLLVALRNGHREIVQTLIYAEADVNLTAALGNSCLHFLVQKGDLDLLQYFLSLQRGTPTTTVQLFAKNRHDETALYHSLHNPQILSCLLENIKLQNYLDPNMFIKGMKITNGVGYNLLHKCAEIGNLQSLSLLAEFVPESALEDMLKQKDIIGQNTPLHLATLADNADMVELLVQCQEVDIDAQNKAGNTALHLALKENLPNVFRILFHEGRARINIPNNDGETCQILAKQLPPSADNIIAMMVLSADNHHDLDGPSFIEKRKKYLSGAQRKSFASDLMKGLFKIKNS